MSKELKRCVEIIRALNDLVSEPEYGHASWWQMVDRLITELWEIWKHD